MKARRLGASAGGQAGKAGAIVCAWTHDAVAKIRDVRYAEGDTMRALIIDDDLVCRRVLARILRNHGDSQAATDGAEGLIMVREAIAAKQPFDLICLDLMMPLLDGHEVLSSIREMEDQGGITNDKRSRVLMVSAMDDNKNVMRAFREQCDGYLIKPVTVDSVANQLRKLELIA